VARGSRLGPCAGLFFKRSADGVAADLEHARDGALREPFAQRRRNARFGFGRELAWTWLRRERTATGFAPEPLGARTISAIAHDWLGLATMRANIREGNHAAILTHTCT
jgi:hypothetical protein